MSVEVSAGTIIMINRLFSFVSYLRHPSIQCQFVFILLTAFFLWVPIRFSGSLPVTFEQVGVCALAVLLTARYYPSIDSAERRINLLSYGMILYGLWVVISAGMHYWAFNSLELEAYLSMPDVTTISTDKDWVIWTLCYAAKAYIFFPFLFLVSMVIFRSHGFLLSSYLAFLLLFIKPMSTLIFLITDQIIL
jgi:hypothetical protein